jgi:hypothetical protein
MKRLYPMQLNVVRFCANECHNQRSGEKSVARMIEAYNIALLYRDCGDEISESMICELACTIDPRNANGYRLTPVTFDQGVVEAAKPEHIQRQMELLLEEGGKLTVDEWVKQFLIIHPFEDGNGRVAAIIYNFLDGMLDAPQEMPDYFTVGAF